MVERYRRNQGRRKLLGNHQKCWIWGRNTVEETLTAGRWEIRELRLSDALPTEESQTLIKRAESQGVPVFVESNDELRRRCRSGEHQGLIAKMTEFPYTDAEQILAEPSPCPLYVILDGIQDPYNFGAIVRSAEVLGVDAIFTRSDRQVGVTSLVARTSAGAVNHIPIARVDSLETLVRQLREVPVRLVAARESAEIPVSKADLHGATAFLIGNEGRGIRDELLQLCDEAVSIPQSGRIGSLNAAVAAGLMFYEAARQRGAE